MKIEEIIKKDVCKKLSLIFPDVSIDSISISPCGIVDSIDSKKYVEYLVVLTADWYEYNDPADRRIHYKAECSWLFNTVSVWTWDPIN